jgi:hypothetical protein
MDALAFARCPASLGIDHLADDGCAAAHHPDLTADQVPDFAVRPMLCERHDGLPPHLVVRTFPEARVIAA